MYISNLIDLFSDNGWAQFPKFRFYHPVRRSNMSICSWNWHEPLWKKRELLPAISVCKQATLFGNVLQFISSVMFGISFKFVLFESFLQYSYLFISTYVHCCCIAFKQQINFVIFNTNRRRIITLCSVGGSEK